MYNLFQMCCHEIKIKVDVVLYLPATKGCIPQDESRLNKQESVLKIDEHR